MGEGDEPIGRARAWAPRRGLRDSASASGVFASPGPGVAKNTVSRGLLFLVLCRQEVLFGVADSGGKMDDAGQ